jgi:hypothetical protein
MPSANLLPGWVVARLLNVHADTRARLGGGYYVLPTLSVSSLGAEALGRFNELREGAPVIANALLIYLARNLKLSPDTIGGGKIGVIL